MIFTSTRSEHSDSPWCEPITSPTLFARGGRTSFARNLCLASTKKRVLYLGRHKSHITNLRLRYTNTNEIWECSIEWSEKWIDDKIARYLQCHLQSKSGKPVDVLRIQAVAGGDHGDTAFQFEASFVSSSK